MTKPGKFYNHVGTETLVQHWGLRAAQQPTYDHLDKASVIVRDEGCGESACRLPQRLRGKSEVPLGRITSNRLCGTWPDVPSTTLLAKTEVSSGGELDV